MQWTTLRNNVEKMQEYRNLQKDISFLKNLLLKMETFDSDSMVNLDSVDDLPKEVDYCEVSS